MAELIAANTPVAVIAVAVAVAAVVATAWFAIARRSIAAICALIELVNCPDAITDALVANTDLLCATIPRFLAAVTRASASAIVVALATAELAATFLASVATTIALTAAAADAVATDASKLAAAAMLLCATTVASITASSD